MTDDEKAFLAQVAIGWFSVDPEGRIWRNVAFQGGGAPKMVRIRKRRAERSSSRAGQYLRVMFRDGSQRRKVSAHRIVWMLANGQGIPDPLEVNHLNGKKSDNRPANLERVTRPENARHSVRVLGNKPKARRGEANASAKLTAATVAQILALAGTMPQREIGAMFGVSQGTVSAVLVGKTWSHIRK